MYELASNLSGYTIRHYLGSAVYCQQVTYKTYLGNVLIGVEKVFTGSCFAHHFFWDEWIPYGTGDELPTGTGSGGGPFFSPDDPLNREPTIDTMPDDDDHTCDSWMFDDSGIRRMNFKCLTELDDTLKAIIWDSLAQHLRPLSQIADTLARRECDSLATWFDQVKAWDDTNTIDFDIIWKGRTDSLTSGPHHDAQSYGLGYLDGFGNRVPSVLHVDPKVHGKAGSTLGRRMLLKALLHESAHAWSGIDHDTTQATANNGYQSYPYFRSLHSAAACVL